MSRAHSGLEGITNCTKCHELGKKVLNSKCLDCHDEIRSLIRSGRGYHSGQQVKDRQCASCHNEHHGRNFKIVNFNANNFNHDQTGYSLTGRHVQLKCTECHNSSNIRSAKLKSRKNTYLGLEQRCTSCHEDYHQGTLSQNCSGCHNTTAFEPATFFNHNNAKFRLTGAHITVRCEMCHRQETRQGKPFRRFTGLEYKGCTSCHKDVHNGKFGQNCTKCHSTSSFREVSAGEFNHDATRYPLTGLHKRVDCRACHKVSIQTKLRHDNCSDCHKDYHNGELTGGVRNYGDCAACHTTAGFSPSSFTVERHSRSKFRLLGSHLAVSCSGCHYRDKRWTFSFKDTGCQACHNNVHGNEIQESRMQRDGCSGCHNEKAWKIVEFDHNTSSFPLLGKHSRVRCSECHRTASGRQLFSSLDTECQSCHADIHGGQFSKGGRTECQACHTPFDWKNTTFDHETTGFPLTGAHRNVQCSECHRAESTEKGQIVIYKTGKTKCSDCH